MSILLERGQRGIMIGQTGSGKTIGAIFQLQNAPFDHVIVLDTKGEPAFNKLAREGESIDFYNSCASFVRAWKRKDVANYCVVRPAPDEMVDLDYMDSVLLDVYNTRKPCLVYVDEAYQWHINGRAGPGLVGLLTRGRSLGISTLLSTQRPAWISRFCFSEAQKFYVYKLSDFRDVKTISEHIPDINKYYIAKRFYFWYFDNAEDMNKAIFYQPVPLPPERVDVDERGMNWI